MIRFPGIFRNSRFGNLSGNRDLSGSELTKVSESGNRDLTGSVLAVLDRFCRK